MKDSLESPDFPKMKSIDCSNKSIYFLYFYLLLLLSIRNFSFLNTNSLLAIEFAIEIELLYLSSLSLGSILIWEDDIQPYKVELLGLKESFDLL